MTSRGPPLDPSKTASGIAVDPRTLDRVIPESRRADGSLRKERKIRPGFTPQEDVARFRSTRQQAVDTRQNLVVGWISPTRAGAVAAGASKPGAGAGGAGGAGAGAQSKAAKKNEKRKEKRREKRETEGEPEAVAENWDSDEDASVSAGSKAKADASRAAEKADTSTAADGAAVDDVADKLGGLAVRE